MEHFLESGMHWRILNFIIFAGILFYFLRKPLSKFWSDRSQAIATEIEEARNLRAQAAQKVVALEKRMGRLDTEVKDLLRAIREEGELEKKKIIEKTKAYAEKLKLDAEQMMTQEVQKTKEQLRKEVAQMSIEMAERLLRDSVQDSDQKRLQDQFVLNLEVQR